MTDLDDLLGLDPEAKEPEVEKPEVEAKEEPEVEEKEEPELEAKEPEPEAKEDEPKEDEEDDSDDPLFTEPDLTKRNEGLMKELQKLRKEQRLAKLAPPTAPAPSTTTAPPMRVPVSVAPDGVNVDVDMDALNRVIETRARAILEEARTPTPEMIQAARAREEEAAFLAVDPGHKDVITRANEADDFISLKIQELMRQGHQITNITDALTLLRDSGAEKQIVGYFPELDGMLDDFVAGRASGDPVRKRAQLDRIAERSMKAGRPRARANGAVRSKARVDASPRSLARTGGSRTSATTSDEKAFAALERDFQANPVKFPSDQYRKMVSLGKKLGIEGID